MTRRAFLASLAVVPVVVHIIVSQAPPPSGTYLAISREDTTDYWRSGRGGSVGRQDLEAEIHRQCIHILNRGPR